jgi:hypothetical protein
MSEKGCVFMKRVLSYVLILLILGFLTGCAGALHSAAARGDVKTIKELLDGGANVNERVTDAVMGPGTTPLDYASRKCQVDAARLLLERGAEIRSLNLAARYDCVEVLRLLIDKGAKIDGEGGLSPLADAAEEGSGASVKLLIERGADPDIAISQLISRNRIAAAQSVEIAAKRVREGKTQIAANSETPPPVVVKSDIDALPAFILKPRENAAAVVIGIENYRQKLPKADFAVSDAKLVSEYLTRAMGYPEENVITIINEHATNVDLAKYFEKWLPNNVEKDGTVFVYFSGHGAPNPKTGDAYLVPYDGDPSFIDQTGYSLKRMYDALGKLPAKEIIVALDSCFSGAGGRSVIAKGARPLVMNLQDTMALSKNMTVLAASSGDQISSTYDQKGHGLFTYFMLKGIKNEDVVNLDGSIKMDDLYGYLKPQVERIARKQFNNEQTPQLVGGK